MNQSLIDTPCFLNRLFVRVGSLVPSLRMQ